jgi:hypothetical protein
VASVPLGLSSMRNEKMPTIMTKNLVRKDASESCSDGGCVNGDGAVPSGLPQPRQHKVVNS